MTAEVSIAMFGSSLMSAYWNAAATYYRGIIRALDDQLTVGALGTRRGKEKHRATI
jgi:hypothetical protein